MTKYFQSFEPNFQKMANFEQSFAHFLLMPADKIIFTFFFIEILINYVRVIVSSFKLFDVVELVLQLFIENAPKSNSIHDLQTVWSVKFTSLRNFRIASITFLKPILLYRLERVPLTVKVDAT